MLPPTSPSPPSPKSSKHPCPLTEDRKIAYDKGLGLGMQLCAARTSWSTFYSGAPLSSLLPVLKGDFVGPSGTPCVCGGVPARRCYGCLTHCLDFGLLSSAVIRFPAVQLMIGLPPRSGLTFLRICTIFVPTVCPWPTAPEGTS